MGWVALGTSPLLRAPGSMFRDIFDGDVYGDDMT